jgi:hypothetical protein
LLLLRLLLVLLLPELLDAAVAAPMLPPRLSEARSAGDAKGGKVWLMLTSAAAAGADAAGSEASVYVSCFSDQAKLALRGSEIAAAAAAICRIYTRAFASKYRGAGRSRRAAGFSRTHGRNNADKWQKERTN